LNSAEEAPGIELDSRGNDGREDAGRLTGAEGADDSKGDCEVQTLAMVIPFDHLVLKDLGLSRYFQVFTPTVRLILQAVKIKTIITGYSEIRNIK
jgi:hypothetical protein